MKDVGHVTPFYRRRKFLRLPEYDYSQPGAYFVTICTQERKPIFGEIRNGIMGLNICGCVIVDCWMWIMKQYPYVFLDEWMIMPNHFHGIIVIQDMECRGGSRAAPTQKRKPLGQLIGAFKTVAAQSIRRVTGINGQKVWQRNYFEHIIRDEKSWLKIQEYILTNPLRWELDRENPNHHSSDEFDTWLQSFKDHPNSSCLLLKNNSLR